MDKIMSLAGADAPTSMELELLRTAIALDAGADASLRIAVTLARTDAQIVNGFPLTETARRANARCLQEIERWRAQQVAEVTAPQILDMAASAVRGSDYHALKVCHLAISCPRSGATPEQDKAVKTCLSAWNSRAARLASAA